MTILLLAAMLSAWLIVQGGGFNLTNLAFSICNLGLVPAELTGGLPVGSSIPLTRDFVCVVDAEPTNWLTPVLSIFLHGSWAHLLGNALFFWVFGNNIEDVMGRGRFLVFFLLCGIAAAAVNSDRGGVRCGLRGDGCLPGALPEGAGADALRIRDSVSGGPPAGLASPSLVVRAAADLGARGCGVWGSANRWGGGLGARGRVRCRGASHPGF